MAGRACNALLRDPTESFDITKCVQGWGLVGDSYGGKDGTDAKRDAGMKSDYEMKSESENLQQQTIEANKRVRAVALKKRKVPCNAFGLMAGTQKDALAQGRMKK